MEIERPKTGNALFPKWKIDIVLDYLLLQDMCDMDNMSLEDLTRKTVFLVSLATAWRVSEIHALSRSQDCLRHKDDGTITLRTA